MTVQFYQFGVAVGGTDPSGGGTAPASSASGPSETFEGAVAAQTTITFSAVTKSVTIRNTHDSNALQVSFDSGATWIDFGSYDTETLNVAASSLLIRPTAGASSYEITGILTS